MGVPFLIWRTLIASKQTAINRESHYTALFTKAVEQLGADKTVKRREFKPVYQTDEITKKPIFKDGRQVPLISEAGEPVGEYQSYEVTVTNYEVRLGAIYALERIAQDSVRDAQPIYLTLCAYLQNNSPPALPDLKAKVADRNDADIIEVLNVISRYSHKSDDDVTYEFTGIHLPHVHLFDHSLRNIVFRECSQLNVKYTCSVDNIEYRECLLGKIEIQDTEVSHLSLIGGSIQSVEVFTCEAEILNITANSESLLVHSSQVVNSMLDVPNRTFLLSSEFTECDFHGRGPQLLGVFNPSIEECKFIRCKFSRCDFSLRDFSAIYFEDCEFVDCNLVKSGLVETNGNRFENCFIDEFVSEEHVRYAHQLWAEFLRHR